jgi:hypothetical protein
MRNYLGFWWYHGFWKKGKQWPASEEFDLLKQIIEARESSITSSEADITTTDSPRAWLTQSPTPLVLPCEPYDLLESFDEDHDDVSCWIVYEGNDPSTIIARRLRRLFAESHALFARLGPDVFESEEEKILEAEINDVALLLFEQTLLERHLDTTTRSVLQAISQAPLKVLSDEAAADRKTAVQGMLETPARIWRCRFARYQSKKIRLRVGAEEFNLQVVPNGITCFINDEETIVQRVQADYTTGAKYETIFRNLE